MSVRRISIASIFVLFIARGLAFAEYIVVSVDSVSPSIPIFFKNEIFEISVGIDLKNTYELVFNRQNTENSQWLLVTPPPNMDATAEFIARQLRFAWSPLSDGLKLTMHISCTALQNVYDKGPMFLSSQSVAFALKKTHHYGEGEWTDISSKLPAYNAEQFERLLKRNSIERNGKIDGTAEVIAVISQQGYVEEALIAESNSAKVDIPALRTVICTKFAPTISESSEKDSHRYKIPVELKK